MPHFLLGNQVNLHPKALEKVEPQDLKLQVTHSWKSGSFWKISVSQGCKEPPTCWSFVSSWCQASTSSSKLAPVAFKGRQQFTKRKRWRIHHKWRTWKLCEKLSNLMVLKKHVPYQDCHLEGYAVCPLNGQPKDLQSFFTAQAWHTEGPLRHSAAAPFRPCGCWTPGVLGWSETSARAEIQIHGPKDFQIGGFPKMVVP